MHRAMILRYLHLMFVSLAHLTCIFVGQTNKEKKEVLTENEREEQERGIDGTEREAS